MPVWGKDTSDRDVTIINNEFVPEFQGIDKQGLIDLISTDVELAAKAAIIVLNSKKGYDNWSTWSVVQNEDTSQYIDYAKQFDNDLERGSQFDDDEPVTPTTTTTIPPTTTTVPEETQNDTDDEIDTTTRSAGITNMFGTPPQDYKPTKTGTFLKYFDTVTSFKKPDPTKFKTKKVDEQIQFPSGRPVNIEEVLDLLEP